MKIIWLIAVVFGTSACNGSGPVAAGDQKAIIHRVSEMLHAYQKDIKEQGLVAEFKYLDSSDSFFWVPPGYRSALSFDSVAAILRRNAPAISSIENSFESLQVFPLSKEVATYTCRLRSVTTDTAGKISTVFFIETGVVVRKRGHWKLLSGQTSLLDE